MCIIKFYTQQHKGIYDMRNNSKIIISIRGGTLLFMECLYAINAVHDKCYLYL